MMNKLFIIQLIISFIVGGGAIALLSFIAERVSSQIAGIIFVFPSTVAFGFFFLGWTLSSKAVAEIVPSTLISLGLSILFAAIYPYFAEYSTRFFKRTLWQIIVSFIISISIWFALSIPIVILHLNHFMLGVIGYALLTLIAHLLLQKKNYAKPVSLTYTLGQKIGRAIFIGFIIVLVVLFGKTLGPFWGGMFSVFPAAFSALIIPLHWYYGPKSLFPTLQKVAIGSISVFAYVLTVMLVFPIIGFIWGTFFAYIISLIITLLLTKFQSKQKI